MSFVNATHVAKNEDVLDRTSCCTRPKPLSDVLAQLFPDKSHPVDAKGCQRRGMIEEPSDDLYICCVVRSVYRIRRSSPVCWRYERGLRRQRECTHHVQGVSGARHLRVTTALCVACNPIQHRLSSPSHPREANSIASAVDCSLPHSRQSHSPTQKALYHESAETVSDT